MGIPIANNGRRFFICATIIAMLAGLFISRATLSISMMLFVAATVLHKDIGAQVSNFFKTPLLAGMALLFFLPLLSGLWSTDLIEWRGLVRIKATLFFLPLAFAGNWQLSKTQWRLVLFIFLLLVLAGTLWSFQNYWADRHAISESYLRAKVFRTPLQNDHVRFSWVVSIAALCCLFVLESERGFLKGFSVLLLLWFAIYLHVLAARTGLFSLYLVLLYYGILKMFQAKNKIVFLLVWLLVAGLPLLAWRAVPTFQNRVRYFLYDYSFIKSGTYLPGGNDGNRALSYRAGWHLLKTHPLGAGAGDVLAETKAWYNKNVPGMADSDKLYPSSEWLLYGGSTGWPGVLLFTGVMLLPFFYKPPAYAFYWQALCGTAAASFLFDIGLEVQYGVFLYAFLLLWWWKWFAVSEKEAT
ncbi:MAG TPA: O-antigen ligase family protein [Chitinophagaceae bacterium]|nr:O-antigen ligase family protein [Chitinophagaceae bacterium]